MRLALIGTFLALVALAPGARAGIITQFDFNTNSTAASTGSGTLGTIGGATSAFFSGNTSSDPTTGTNRSLAVATFPTASAGDRTRGIEVAVNTTGFVNIAVSFDLYQQNTSSKYFQLQASSDGTNFLDVSDGFASFGAVQGNTNTVFTSSGLYSTTSAGGSAPPFVQQITYQFPTGSAYENNPNFKFRVVAAFDPNTGSYSGSNGSYTGNRVNFDMVTVSSVPEPGGLALLALVALPAARLLRRKRSR